MRSGMGLGTESPMEGGQSETTCGRVRRRTILFLITDTGAGRRSAANAVACAMRLASHANEPDWDAVIVDGVKECGRLPVRQWVFLYGPGTKYCPRVFGAFFHATDTPERAETSHRLCHSMLRDGLRRLLERMRPDVIVSMHHFRHIPLDHSRLRIAVHHARRAGSDARRRKPELALSGRS
jgi:LmbE family N-acetylglucosaminyl deacetylase